MGKRLASMMEWIDTRFPLTETWRSHLAEYYAPKNFNFWYYFGSLALLVLVIQIVTGIFLTMNYKPDASMAFASVEYIMRDVEWGWLIRYMHSTGASMFFIVVYLHMFRGLMYGSYRKPRELLWIFGMRDLPCPDVPAFIGYLLPWGQMSYWGAQVIVNLFGAIPVIGQTLSIWIRGDYMLSDATLNRFFAFHVVALPVLLVPGRRAHRGAARSRLEQSGRHRDQGEQGPGNRHSGRRHSLPPVLHGEGHGRRGRVSDRVLRHHLLRAGDGRLLPRVQQLHSGQSAEDARSHRAGLVFHAVLLDAAGGHCQLSLDRRKALGHRADGRFGRHLRPPALAGSQPRKVDPLQGPLLQDRPYALCHQRPCTGLARNKIAHAPVYVTRADIHGHLFRVFHSYAVVQQDR